MANKKPWGFTQNPFNSAHGGTYRLAVRISEYHLGALSSKAGDAFFDTLIASFTPLNVELTNAYGKWKADGGSQQSKTLLVTQSLKSLASEKISDWDIAIQTVYKDNTTQYKALLPDKRKPFQNGSQEDRISAVLALTKAIGSDAALSVVKADVEKFLTDIQIAITTQKGSITTTKSNSDAVEAARVAMCTGMYANLGALIQHYADTPENIDQYFDLSVIRSGAQTVFTGETKAQEKENIMKRTFLPDDSVLLKNEGVTELRFYLAAQKKDSIGDKFITVAAGNEKQVTAGAIGEVANLFFNVFNPDTINEGEWTVELQ